MHKRPTSEVDTNVRDLTICVHSTACITLPSLHSTPTAIMPKSCVICSAVASPDLQLQYCSQCQSALYCSKACQRKDWKKQHKKICKFLNVGHGDMQIRTDEHTSRFNDLQEAFEGGEGCRNEDDKRFFKLFQESTFEGSRAAAQKMMKIAKRQTKHNQRFLLFHSLRVLARSNSEMLSWPSSPLLVMLQFVDPNVMFADELASAPLNELADLATPSDYSTHVNQLILAKQLIAHGANVNTVSKPEGETPLHNACYEGVVTNLDFIELLLVEGVDPNCQDRTGCTALVFTTPNCPSAAKFLLNWPATDANIIAHCGASFLAGVRKAVEYFAYMIARPNNPDRLQHQFLLQQWQDIEEMLVERGALDTGIPAF
jgi:hypothetical protein